MKASGPSRNGHKRGTVWHRSRLGGAARGKRANKGLPTAVVGSSKLTTPAPPSFPGPSASPSGHTPATRADRAGIAAGGNLHNFPPDVLGRYLDEVRSSGARWIRIDINWSLIQARGPSSYDWASFDRVVHAAIARDLKVLATVLYTPAWARPGTPHPLYPPTDLATYAAFCREAVKHYAPMGVRHWEIWNEPNLFFWKPAPDPGRYAAMLRLASTAIRQADQQAFVVSAGLAPYGAYGDTGPGSMNPLTFLERIYAAGARGHFDALGWHPYDFAGFRFHPSSAWSQVSETPTSARSIMAVNGDGDKPLWATEYGVPTGTSPGAVSEARQAETVTEAYARWKAWSWAGPLFWYSFRDAGVNPSDREDNFGLVRHDFSAKPSFAAYRVSASG
jgi:polysaccharide biosynthesis protein PslG